MKHCRCQVSQLFTYAYCCFIVHIYYAAALSTAAPTTTGNKPSRSHEAADAGNSCGEVQQEGQQSQQQNEEETEEGEIIIGKYNCNKSW